MFTWVPIYKELSEKVIALKNSPESLIRIVKDIEKEYGIKINDPKEGRKVLVDINTIVDFIIENQKN